MRRKLLVVLMSFVLICMGVAGCSGQQASNEGKDTNGSGEKVEITIWTSYGTKAMGYLKDIASEFNKSQDKYTASVETGGTVMQIRQKMATSKPKYYPSIFFGANNAIYEYSSADYLVPIQDFIDKDSDKWAEDIYENVKLSYCDADGKMIAWPIGVSVKGYFVNVDMIKAAGYTVEDLTSFEKIAEVARAAHDKGLCKYGYVINEGTDIVNMLIYQGVDLVDADNGYTGNVTKSMYTEGDTNAALKKVSKILADMYKDGIAYPNSDGAGGGSTPFINGQVAFWSCTNSALNKIEDVDLGFEYTFVPLTGIDANAKYQNCALTEGTGMFISNTGNEAEMQGAYEFIKFLSQPEYQFTWCSSIGYIPYTEEAANYSEWITWRDANFPAASELVKAMEAAPKDLKFPYTKVMTQIISGSWDIVDDIAANTGGEVDTYINDAAKSINESIEMLNLRGQ